jgi:hypothetical protein
MAADVRDIPRTPTWLRSSRCGPQANTNCVEVGRGEEGVLIRDSKGAAILGAFTDVQWSTFLASCRTMR